jgi:hypothetical protein
MTSALVPSSDALDFSPACTELEPPEAVHGRKLSSRQQSVDRQLACLDNVLAAWVSYATGRDPSGRTTVARTYQYASALNPDTQSYIDEAISPVEWPLPQVSAAPGMRELGDLNLPGADSNLDDLHEKLATAYASNARLIAAALGGPCPDECRAVQFGDVMDYGTPVAICQVYIATCVGMMATIWRMYEYTGDERFFDVDAGLLAFVQEDFGADASQTLLDALIQDIGDTWSAPVAGTVGGHEPQATREHAVDALTGLTWMTGVERTDLHELHVS